MPPKTLSKPLIQHIHIQTTNKQGEKQDWSEGMGFGRVREVVGLMAEFLEFEANGGDVGRFRTWIGQFK